MKRRTLLKLGALGGVATLGLGFWALPTGVAPGEQSLSGAQTVLGNLSKFELTSLKGWNPIEVFNHCAQSIEYSINGYPDLKSNFFRHSIGPLAFSVFEA